MDSGLNRALGRGLHLATVKQARKMRRRIALELRRRYLRLKQETPAIGDTMWIIVRTSKGKNSYLTSSGEWSNDGNDADGFAQFDYAVSHRDRMVPERHRRGVGIVKQTQGSASRRA